MALPGVALGDPVRFQASVLQSRAVLGPVVAAHYAVARTLGSADSTRGSLLDILDVHGRSSEERDLRGMERLKTLMWLQADPVTGLITLRVTTRWPELSMALTQKLIESLNVSNMVRQQSAAETEARFSGDCIGGQSAPALATAETKLEEFLKENREYRNSPGLVLQYGRVERRIDLMQQVVVSLAQSYEQSRIEAARDIPIVSVVDAPDGSAKEAGRPVRDGAVWALCALALVTLVLLARDAVERAREGDLDLDKPQSLLSCDRLKPLKGRLANGYLRKGAPDSRPWPGKSASRKRLTRTGPSPSKTSLRFVIGRLRRRG